MEDYEFVLAVKGNQQLNNLDNLDFDRVKTLYLKIDALLRDK